jgi:LysM repeat protein
MGRACKSIILRTSHRPYPLACLLLLVILGLGAGVPAVVCAVPGAEPTTYVVSWGDTLSSIARRYGTTVSAIAQANQLSNPNWIYVGQRLAIPGTTSPAPTTSGLYVVRRGDTLSVIAARYGTTVQRLVQMNGLTNPNLIIVGQRLAVPEGAVPNQPARKPATSTVYHVQRGDTLIGIAMRFGVSMWDIVLANGIANPSFIYVGQSLVIPGAQPTTDNNPAPAPTRTAAPPRQSATPTPRDAAPTVAPPTPTRGPAYLFRYVQGSMRQYPNCGTVYFKGQITGVGGEPVSGRTVRLRFSGHVVYNVSGVGQNPGEWGFAPLAPENYHSPFTFLIDIVESEANPAPQSDPVEIRFTDCGAAGQFDSIVFQYSTGNPTPVPTRDADPTPAPNTPLPSLEWDPRLNALPCVGLQTVADRGIQLRPGDKYWRLVRARWLSEEESRRDIQIHVDLLDEAGDRVYGEVVIFANGGSQRVVSEPQSCCYPWDYPVKYPMFNVLCSYRAYVEALPSDMVVGMGLGTPEHPDWTVHTGFVLTFQRTVYR